MICSDHRLRNSRSPAKAPPGGSWWVTAIWSVVFCAVGRRRASRRRVCRGLEQHVATCCGDLFFVRAKRQHRRKVAAHLDRELAILKGQYHPVYQFDPKTRAVFVPAEWLVGEPFNEYALACGAILARAHARTGDAAKIAGYCGKSEEFGEARVDFADSYSVRPNGTMTCC
jgi:hypothetical protein